MGEGHAHRGSNERNLKIALGLTATYLVAEVVGGLLTGSLALLSDAAHMLTDVAALAISLVAIKLAKRPADARRTFGYYRFEILAAAFNAAVLFVVAFYILFEAYQRFREPSEIESLGMLVVAAVGLVVNLISVRLLRAGSSGSLNMKSAYLEVWSDLLGSIAVIVAAVIIRVTGWTAGRSDPRRADRILGSAAYVEAHGREREHPPGGRPSRDRSGAGSLGPGGNRGRAGRPRSARVEHHQRKGVRVRARGG